MKNYNKELSTVYIPDTHKKYDILPTCRKYNVEMIVWDNTLLNEIKKITNMNDHETCPYQRYNSYKEFFDEIDNWLKKYPNCKEEITEYKDSIIKMNNKDLWAIVKYVGETNWGFTKNNYYYVVMYIENNSWVIRGIIDNEEYDAFLVWSSKCTAPVDLVKDFKIIINPSNNLKNEFAQIMKML